LALEQAPLAGSIGGFEGYATKRMRHGLMRTNPQQVHTTFIAPTQTIHARQRLSSLLFQFQGVLPMSSAPSTSDRDLSFKEIDFDGKACRMMERIVSLAEDSDDAC
jgi:hypothetical protein